MPLGKALYEDFFGFVNSNKFTGSNTMQFKSNVKTPKKFRQLLKLCKNSRCLVDLANKNATSPYHQEATLFTFKPLCNVLPVKIRIILLTLNLGEFVC